MSSEPITFSESQPLSDEQATQQAIGLLLGQRGHNTDEALRLLDQAAQREGRQPAEMARELLARAGAPEGRSPVSLALAYTELGEAIKAAPGDIALRRITEMAVERLSGASWASLTVLHGDTLATVAATDTAAQEADRLQYQLDEGPCVSAASDATTSAYLSVDLLTDQRWPRFAARAHAALGVRSMLSVRLGLDIDELDDTLASLNVYATTPGVYGDDAIVSGTLLAAHASTAVIASQYQHRVTHLEEALRTNREIGMAMGILMHQQKVTGDRAFAMLRIASQHTNRKLRDIADDVVHTGALPLPPNLTAPAGGSGLGGRTLNDDRPDRA